MLGLSTASPSTTQPAVVATQPTTAKVTLQGAMDKSLKIKGFVQNYQFQEAKATAKELYRDGVEMIRAELRARPVFNDEESVLPIAISLEAAIGEPGVQDFVGLMRSISKTYRLFVELRSYQSWRVRGEYPTESMPIHEEIRNRFIETTNKLETILRARTGSVGAMFELRCARQAARQLTPSVPHWKKYLLHLVDLGVTAPSIYGGDITATWGALKNLAEDLYRDDPLANLSWYAKIQILRWESTRVENETQFTAKVGNNIGLCKRRGGNYSLCLAKIFMELINRPGVAQEVKERAFRGNGEQDGLVQMIGWRSKKTPRGLTQKVLDSVRSAADHFIVSEDRFFETRELVCYYLRKLARKSANAGFKLESFQALLKQRITVEADSKKSCSIQKEKEHLQHRIDSDHRKFTEINTNLGEIGHNLDNIDQTRSRARSAPSLLPVDEGRFAKEEVELVLKEELLKDQQEVLKLRVAEIAGLLDQAEADVTSTGTGTSDTEKVSSIRPDPLLPLSKAIFSWEKDLVDSFLKELILQSLASLDTSEKEGSSSNCSSISEKDLVYSTIKELRQQFLASLSSSNEVGSSSSCSSTSEKDLVNFILKELVKRFSTSLDNSLEEGSSSSTVTSSANVDSALAGTVASTANTSSDGTSNTVFDDGGDGTN